MGGVAKVDVPEADRADVADELFCKLLFELECALGGAPLDGVLEALTFVCVASRAGDSGAVDI